MGCHHKAQGPASRPPAHGTAPLPTCTSLLMVGGSIVPLMCAASSSSLAGMLMLRSSCTEEGAVMEGEKKLPKRTTGSRYCKQVPCHCAVGRYGGAAVPDWNHVTWCSRQPATTRIC